MRALLGASAILSAAGGAAFAQSPGTTTSAITNAQVNGALAGKVDVSGGIADALTIKDPAGAEQIFAVVPSPDTATAGPPIAVFGNSNLGCCNNDELTMLYLSHRGYGRGDTATALIVSENLDVTNIFAGGDGGFDQPGQLTTSGQSTEAIASGIVGKEPVARVQVGEGIQYAFTQPSNSSQQLAYSATGVTFSPSIPASLAGKIRPRMTVQTNSLSGTSPDPFRATVMLVQKDRGGNVTGLTVNGWSAALNGGSGSTARGQVPPYATGLPVIAASGAGYAVGDTVTMNTADGHHAASFTVTETWNQEGVAPPTGPHGTGSGALGEVAALRLTAIIGSNFATPDGRFSQVGTSGSGRGLVLDLNPTVWIDTNDNAFARSTECVLQAYYNEDPYTPDCIGDEIDVINDYGDIHHYDGRGVATDPPTAGLATQAPYLIAGMTIQSLGVNAASFGYGALGDMEVGFYSAGAREHGFWYSPAGGTQGNFFQQGDGFESDQSYGLAFVVRPGGNAATPSFSVDAATGTVALGQAGLALAPGSSELGTVLPAGLVARYRLGNAGGTVLSTFDTKGDFSIAGEMIAASIYSGGALGAAGGLQLNTSGTGVPSCGASTRGLLWFAYGRGGAGDRLDLCRINSAGAYAWEPLGN